MDSELGISVGLPPGTASEYQRRREHELARRRREAEAASAAGAASATTARPGPEAEAEADAGAGAPGGGSPLLGGGSRPLGIDLDREIVPFRLPTSGDSDESSDGGGGGAADGGDNVGEGGDDAGDDAGGDNADYEDGGDEDDDDDNISLSPPSSMPLLLIDLENLTGRCPSSEEERDVLAEQLRDALLGPPSKEEEEGADADADADADAAEVGGGGSSGGSGGAAPAPGGEAEMGLDFGERIAELFAMGAVSHCDTDATQQRGDLRRAAIGYPEFLPVPGEGGAVTAVSTARVWKLLTSPHRIGVVARLLSHLAVTSRDLGWRYQMNLELRGMARSEQDLLDRRNRAEALQEWRGGRRKAELEKLYEVRETFERRLDMARTDFEGLVEEREGRVRAELRRRKELGEGGGGVDGLDWTEGAATFIFGDEELGAADKVGHLSAREDGYGSDQSNHSLSEHSGYGHDEVGESGSQGDGEESQDENEVVAEHVPMPPSIETSQFEASTERRKRRAAKASKRMRRRLARLEEEAKQRAMIDAARAEEESIRESCMRHDERLARAVLDQLEEKVSSVDDLLEHLQEEEWAEEEGALDITDKPSDASAIYYEDLDEERANRPLLDQILAMILGSIHTSEGRSKEDHFQFVRDEHQTIVTEWRDHFGRLPLSASEQDVPEPTEAEDMNVAVSAMSSWHLGNEDVAQGNIGTNTRTSHTSIEATAEPTPEAMRSMFGISDNADGDWDDAGWDDLLPDIGNSSAVPLAKQQKPVGLRPGGGT